MPSQKNNNDTNKLWYILRYLNVFCEGVSYSNKVQASMKVWEAETCLQANFEMAPKFQNDSAWI